MAGRKKGTKDAVPRKNGKFDTPNKQKFLRHLEKHGNVASACAHCGISRTTVYLLTQKDERFKARFDLAKERAIANLEDEMEKRIYEGDEKLEYGYDEDGKEHLKKKTVSKDNTLLMRALEANDPGKYSRKTEQTQNLNVNVNADSAISKLAEFLKVDLPAPDQPKEIQGETLDGDWGERDD